MTRGQIRQRILEALNDSVSSPVFWSTGQIDTLIDEAQEVLAEEIAAFKRTALVGLRPGTQYYYTTGIAPDMMTPYRMRIETENWTLSCVTMTDLDQQYDFWQTTTGSPLWWFPVSWDLFGLYPKAVDGGGVLRVDYLAWPRSLMDDDDEPECPVSDHDALVLYGVYDGLLKQWDGDRAVQVFSLFMQKLGKGKYASGLGVMQSRTWQSAATPGNKFPSALERYI